MCQYLKDQFNDYWVGTYTGEIFFCDSKMNSIKTTEQINPKSTNIHKKKISDILIIFNSAQLVGIKSIQKIIDNLEKKNSLNSINMGSKCFKI